MPNRIEARSAKAALTNATGRLPLLRLFSTPLIKPRERSTEETASLQIPVCSVVKIGDSCQDHSGVANCYL